MGLFIVFLEERNWGVHVEVLIVESAAAHPLPVPVVDRPIGVNQEFIKNSGTQLPVNPEITSCQETGYELSGLVVDPTFLLQLAHGSVNSWEACHSLLP